MIYNRIKSFYILIVLILNSLMVVFIEVGEANLLACGVPSQNPSQNSLADSEIVLQKIRNLKAPILIKDVATYRCGGSISVWFTDAQGTDFVFGVDDYGLLYFNVGHPWEDGAIQLQTGYEEAKTILLNLLKDWVQDRSSNQQTEQSQPPKRPTLEEEWYSRLLIVFIERVEKR